ncbi:hypothetical protein [Spongiactinospora sp. 9N601]|uniref:hypothetical protein n=1 Tax=Spongiactinospora sp. 9N601 TaxID=3375149 RepID=UPI003793453D
MNSLASAAPYSRPTPGKDPLPPEARARLLARDPIFVASHWVLAGAAVVGVIVALLTL